jgi:hypothetical protein
MVVSGRAGGRPQKFRRQFQVAAAGRRRAIVVAVAVVDALVVVGLIGFILGVTRVAMRVERDAR